MSFEKPMVEKGKEMEPKSFEQEMASLEASLQNLLAGGKDVNWEKQMEDIQSLLKVMRAKYQKDEKIAKFFRQFEYKVGGIVFGMGMLAIILGENKAGAITAAGGVALSALAGEGNSKFAIRAQKIKGDIEELINTSREFTDEYLYKGGAEDRKYGGLELTKEQVEKAREEMNKDLGTS